MAPKELPEPDLSEFQSEFLQENSAVAGPVRNALDLQLQYYALNRQFQDEMWRLEKQHYARCQSLFQDRRAVISGIDTAAQRRGTPSPAPAIEIPNFWLQAMKNNPIIGDWIKKDDEPALKFLRDVRVEFVDGKDISAFKIAFDFDENPYFSNTTLTKEFIYERDSPQDDIYGELQCGKALGCDISWHPGQNLTGIVKTVDGQLEYESFFDFFESHSSEDDESNDSDGEVDGTSNEPDDEEEESALSCDFDLGEEIKDALIPYAIHWYTGEALLFEDDEVEEVFEDEDEEEDENDE